MFNFCVDIMKFHLVVKYEVWLENGTLVSESKEGVEFRISDGMLSLLSYLKFLRVIHRQVL